LKGAQKKQVKKTIKKEKFLQKAVEKIMMVGVANAIL